jgi:hypothetical protein
LSDNKSCSYDGGTLGTPKGVKSHETVTYPESVTTWNVFEFDKE